MTDIFYIYEWVLIFGALFFISKDCLKCALCSLFKDCLGFDFMTSFEWNDVVLDHYMLFVTSLSEESRDEARFRFTSIKLVKC